MTDIVEYNSESAREFMEYLSPLNNRWVGGRYIFRGQGDAGYKLIPSACRRKEGAFAAGSPMRAFGTQSADQVKLEQAILNKFLRGCDNSGLVVPGYNAAFKNNFNLDSNKFIENPKQWPSEEFYEVLAAAQHHGIPTRLLDWSRRSYVAAYFAATSSSYMYSSEKDRIAVWALDISKCTDWRFVKLIDPPGGTSKNLAAQSGVFTMQVNSDLAEQKYSEIPFESITELQGSLVKVTMSNYHVPELVRLCASFGVQGSTLFPGYEGVARDVVEFAQELVGIRFPEGHYDLDYDDFDINDHI